LNVRYDILPTVSLTSPANGDSFVFGTTIHLTAIANDSDGLVSEVQFYIYPGSQRISVYSSPYEFDWTPDTRGQYSVVAIAIDNDNWSSVTPDILISVQ